MKIKLLITLLVLSTAVFAGCKEKEKDIIIPPPTTDPTGGFADTGTILDTVYVSTTGSPTGDGSAGDPYDTLNAALAVAQPGDMILLAAGTYAGGAFKANLKGNYVNPIVIAGDPGGGTIISGGTNAFQLSDPEYVVIQDLEITGQSGNGINIDDGGIGSYATPAHHIVIRNVYVHDIGGGGNQDGIKLSGVDYFLIEISEISYCGGGTSGSGIDMVGCHHGVIRANYLHHGSGNSIQGKGGTEGILIWQNFFFEGGERALNLGGSTGADYFRPQGADYEARNLRALVNIFVSCNAPISYVGCDGALAANNTIYLPQTWVARILQESVTGFILCRNGRFINNIIVFNQGDLSTYVNVGPDTAPDTFTFANNLWHCLDNPGFTGPSLPVTETGGIYQQDPLFANPGGNDFHLGSLSPARGKGQRLWEVPADYDGIPYSWPPTLGVYEIP
jgi:hypothetical protein